MSSEWRDLFFSTEPLVHAGASPDVSQAEKRCVCVCVCVCVVKCRCEACLFVSPCSFACLCVCIYASVCVRMCTCGSTHTHTHTHTHKHTNRWALGKMYTQGRSLVSSALERVRNSHTDEGAATQARGSTAQVYRYGYRCRYRFRYTCRYV